LIVDDDIDDQQFLIEALVENDPSCHCFTAFNGEEALAKLDTFISAPDMIFLDLNMPVSNGRKFLARFSQTPFFQSTPVIIYSTTSDKNEIRDLSKQGAAHFLTKQHSFQTLRKELSAITSHF
jgi:CheY-like chemotaxis protein